VPVTDTFKDHILDLLEPIDGITAKRMFGGAGVFRDGLMFALMVDDRLYLKADAQTQGGFEAIGAEPFTYQRAGKTIALSYFEAGDDVMDDADELVIWAGQAWEAARRSAKPKKK